MSSQTFPGGGLDSALIGATVLVTGGAGLVGSYLGAELKRRGARTIAIDPCDAYPVDQVSLFRADDVYDDIVTVALDRYRDLRLLVANCDYVVHAAAYADVHACTRNPSRAFRNNLIGTDMLYQSIAETSRVRRLVAVSSASVYGNNPKPVWAENEPLLPISIYANSKLWLENETRLRFGASNTEWAVARYFSVYGGRQVPKPGSHSWCFAWFAAAIRSGIPLRLFGGGLQVRDFTHVLDIAWATAELLTAREGNGQIVNIGTGVPTSIARTATLVAAALGVSQIETVVDSARQGDPPGGAASTYVRDRVLGPHRWIGVEEGVEEYALWATSEQFLKYLYEGGFLK